MLEQSVISIVTGSILGIFAGASLTWSSPEIPYLNSTDTGPFNGTLTDNEASWIGGILSLGAVPGPFITGYFADKIGRKFTILLIAVPFTVSYILTAFSATVTEFYLARFISGLCVGGTFTILPMYVGEMSLDEHRGALGSLLNVSTCFGLIYSYIIGFFVENVAAFNILVAGLIVAFIILFWFVGCETPHWYVSKNKHDLAQQTLLKIRKASEDAVEKELEQIKSIIESEQPTTVLDIFRSKGNTKAFIMGSGLLFFQQTSGICAILFFAQSIFEKSGTSLKAQYCSMIIGGVQFITSFITPSVSNYFGRKLLLIFSGIGIFLSESLLGVYSFIDDSDPEKVSSLNFLPVVLLVMYIITYNVGFGPLPWAVIGEIFPTNIKSTASALATSVCWITSFFVTKWFGQIVAAVGQGGCFLGFALASLIAVGFTQFCVLETKGKSLAQIQEDLNK